VNECHCLTVCFDQSEADEIPKGDGDCEDVDITGDCAWAEASTQGESATMTTGNDTKVELNVSAELPLTTVAIDSIGAGITHQPKV
jgi:hypothetical protein